MAFPTLMKESPVGKSLGCPSSTGDVYGEPALGIQGSRHGPFLWPNNTFGGGRGLHWVRGCRKDTDPAGGSSLAGV